MKKTPFNIQINVDDLLPASSEDKAYMVKMRPSTTFFKDGVKRLLKNKIATISLITIVIITLTSIILPIFWPYSYDQQLGISPGAPVDPSYNNLAPFEYGSTEQAKIDAGERYLWGCRERSQYIEGGYKKYRPSTSGNLFRRKQ